MEEIMLFPTCKDSIVACRIRFFDGELLLFLGFSFGIFTRNLSIADPSILANS